MSDIGIAFDSLPPLARVRDLEWFEGPILSELQTPTGTRYLEKWCTIHDGATRTLVVRTDPRAIAEYLARRTTLVDLLTKPNDDVGFLVDRVRGERRGTRLVQVSLLPDKYLPRQNAKHDESLRPEWDMIPQAFLVNTNWNTKLLFDLEKLYLTVFALCYFTTPENDVRPPAAARTYVLDGGFSYGHLFRTFRESVPKSDNARSVGVSAASPGVLMISAPSATAERVSEALQSAAREHTQSAYVRLHDWSRLPDKKAEQLPPTAVASLHELSKLLLVDTSKLLPESHTPTQVLRAGKIVAAYYRHLWRLLDPSWEGVEFLAPEVERTSEAPAGLYDEEDEEDYVDIDNDADEDEP